ncbi:hypothetical protein GALMADRAFT_144328 [Galerina marginata CBS 339.88]|uniref:Piwi domain-containing protein n=1 Tax=Galerina marginata (strain CBS 339.88) TaxID=685588 RepID=A0A067SVP4_GALM3|nr:hypothetical protein GALMADRAFT_144328 [Galerina marginata CBS 339.88]
MFALCRLSSSADVGVSEAIRSSLSGIHLQLAPNTRPTLRPGFGNLGRSIKLHANYFPVNVAKGPWFEYDVSISPVAGRRTKRRIFQLAEQSPGWKTAGLFGSVAHDCSSRLISPKKLAKSLSFSVPYNEEDGEQVHAGNVYTLTLEYVRDIETKGLLKYLKGKPEHSDIDTSSTISALNLILSAHPNRFVGGGTVVGRNRFFFPTATQPSNLGGGLEAWNGFYSSVRPTRNGLMVNVNVCTTAFYKPGNLAESMVAFTKSVFRGNRSAFVRGVRVKTQHLGHRIVKALFSQKSRKQKLSDADLDRGQFQAIIKASDLHPFPGHLRYPKPPLVNLGGDIIIPAEQCEILPAQPFRGQLTDAHSAAMIEAATKPPQVNATSITGVGLDVLGYKPGVSQQLKAFGISIENQMAVVPGRILPPPVIKYSKGEPKLDDRASWNLKGAKFVKGAKIGPWAVLVIKDGQPQHEFSGSDDPDLLATVRGFASGCRASGMVVDQKDPVILEAHLPPTVPTDPARTAAIEVIRQQLASLSEKPSMVMVLLSNTDKAVYSGVKHLCDGDLVITSVCVQSALIRREKGQPRYFSSVGSKLNMKLGGVNHTLAAENMTWLQKMPTMLVGIDVTHPGRESMDGSPSITAVVASCKSDFAQYPASLELQASGKELVKQRCFAQRILVYRDGISESQFKSVLDEELPAIRLACETFDTLESQYRPAVTIVVCGKRHHTRFYPIKEGDADQNGNPQPGTVVDRGVTSVYNFDFFLQAHGALQGTARPTHYYVLHDDNAFQADELQALTNDVSYMFARATQAVSLVSPAYYAHLACERGRYYLYKFLQSTSNIARSASSDDKKSIMDDAQKAWRDGVGGKLKDSMFYI